MTLGRPKEAPAAPSTKRSGATNGAPVLASRTRKRRRPLSLSRAIRFRTIAAAFGSSGTRAAKRAIAAACRAGRQCEREHGMMGHADRRAGCIIEGQMKRQLPPGPGGNYRYRQYDVTAIADRVEALLRKPPRRRPGEGGASQIVRAAPVEP